MWLKFIEVVFIGTGALLVLAVVIVGFVITTALKFERMREMEEEGLRELYEKQGKDGVKC